MLRALVALATVHTAAGLHAVLTAAQGRDLARRWSPEYNFEMPKTHSAVGRVVKLRDVRRYVEVTNILRERVSDASNGPKLACVVQYTRFRGLTLFVLRRADDGGGGWNVLTQLPALDEDDDYQSLSRQGVVEWFQDLHEIAGEA